MPSRLQRDASNRRLRFLNSRTLGKNPACRYDTPSRHKSAIFSGENMFRLTTLGLALTLTTIAHAHDYRIGDVRVGHPYASASLPGATTAAGYLSISNDGKTATRLVAASTDAAARSEIHESTVQDGVARMRELPDGLTIAPGATIKLEPRSYHLMLHDLKAPFVKGERVKLVLTFEPEGDVEVELAIEALAAAPHHH